MRRATSYLGKEPDVVIGGFHFLSRRANANEKPTVIEAIAKELVKTKTQFYTGHCTGLEGYSQLKKVMGSQIQYFATGQTLHL